MEQSSLRRHGPLLLLGALEAAGSIYLTLTRTIPRGHDGFQYFYLKYYFFNDVVQNGEVAQWMPNLSHGSPAAWWYMVQSGIFDLPVIAVARIASFGNFIAVFYALLFLEKLLLIAGTWLLASAHMESRLARFATTAAVTFSTIWYTGVWWNFHALLALPLLLFLINRSLLDFRWSWVTGLSLVMFLQFFGQLSYFLPITLLLLAAYAVLLLIQPEARSAFTRGFRFSAVGFLTVAMINAGTLLALLWLRGASREISFVASQRQADGSVSLETFLTHGGSMDLRPWIQFFTGITPHLDFTMFAGFLIASLVTLTAFSGPINRSQRVFAWLAVITVLIGTSSPLALLLYYFWPLGNLFRHLTLVMPVARMFCVFLAGLTLDRLLTEPQQPRTGRLVATALTSAAWFAVIVIVSATEESRELFVRALKTAALPIVDNYAALLAPRFILRGATFAALTGIALVMLVRARAAGSRVFWGRIAVGILLADLLTYNLQEMHERTLPISEREAQLFTAQPLPYQDRRSQTGEDVESPRFRTFYKTSGRIIGTRYWAEDLLWFTDGYTNVQFTVIWSQALESLLGAIRRRPGLMEIGLDESLPLPLDDKLVSAIGGFREPKVRFFTGAVLCPDELSSALVLAEPSFDARAPVVTAAGGAGAIASLGVPTTPCTAAGVADRRLTSLPPARNTAFTANRAEFAVENSTASPVVMTYSDTWSDRWRASVDGSPVAVLRSNLAYKAVVVPPGQHRVLFEYRDRLGGIVFILQGLASVGLLVFLTALWLTRT